MGTTDQIYTYWSTVSRYSIRIPIIQRDYAQGRVTPTVDEIRDTFLNAIHDSLTNDRPLHLDFVYGSIQGEKGETAFVPLDGQQRLTTLFLLHWYLAWQEGVLHEPDISNRLANFTYETRTSSREFCSALVNVFDEPYNRRINTVSEIIRDSAWYFLAWDQDPTIRPMLNMLDAIHRKFSGTSGLFQRLVCSDDCPITFDFLELENFGLEEDLYIRMNARGKSLTAFEVFKARFQQRLNDIERNGELPSGYALQFMLKMDTTWTDFFWRHRNTGKNLIDEPFLHFLCRMFDNLYFGAAETNQYDVRSLHTDRLGPERLGRIGADNILELERVLDALSALADRDRTFSPIQEMDERDILSRILNAQDSALTYSDRLKFHAYCKYFATCEYDEIHLQEWMRVMRNLITNTTYDQFSDYTRGLRAIDHLTLHIPDIIEYLASSGNRIPGFFGSQMEEERLKAELILSGEEWETAIKETEEHPYFSGQIGFLLDFAGADAGLTEEEKTRVYTSFMAYKEKAEAIFDGDGVRIREGEQLWRRALLCVGNYTLKKNSNISFVVDGNDRDISWKRLLRSKGAKRNFVQVLLDQLDVRNIQNGLRQVIRERAGSISDWRKYFILYPELMNACGQQLYIRVYDETRNILLLEKTRTSGYCREYYSYALFWEIKKKYPDSRIEYLASAGEQGRKCCALEKRGILAETKRIYIGYDRENGRWLSSKSEEMTNARTYGQPDEVIDFLLSKKYIIAE